MRLDTLDSQAALKRRLEEAFPAVFPGDPEAEKTIEWIADNIHRGLTRVYAVNVDESSGAEQHKRLVERIRQRIDDPELIRQAAQLLETPPEQSDSQEEILAPVLANIAFEKIDHMLQQVEALGRQDNFAFVKCRRVGNELIILVDRDSRYDWVLPAVQKRLREELSELKYNIDYVNTQLVDLSQGNKLRFLGFELWAVPDRDGGSRVQYKRIAQPVRRQRKRGSGRLRGPARWNLRQRCRDVLTACIAPLRKAPALLPALTKRRLGAAAAVLGVAVVFAVWWSQPPKPTIGFLDCVYTDPDDDEDYKYVLYVPPTYDKDKLTPLMVFLHGTHEKGTDGRAQLKVGLAQAIWRSLKVPGTRPFNFLALFPQSRSGSWMADSPDGDLVMAEIADVEKNYAVDPARIYLTGHSSGGTGTWGLAMKYPNRWAAIVPVCGYPNFSSASTISHIPCWCFHGTADGTIPVTVPQQMIQALKDAGGKPRYTELPGLFHNIWRNVYIMPELYEWLEKQRLDQPVS
ncbi:MAG TPA: hypothetical protein VMF69_00695 [Gemmataceae bacterium]|nr:hypothetical protein [Gemmataceae bacterium]